MHPLAAGASSAHPVTIIPVTFLFFPLGGGEFGVEVMPRPSASVTLPSRPRRFLYEGDDEQETLCHDQQTEFTQSAA